MRREALENSEPASCALERVRQYGVASLFPGAREDFPFLVYAQALLQYDVGGASAGGIVAVVLANVVAIFLVRLVGKNLDK